MFLVYNSHHKLMDAMLLLFEICIIRYVEHKACFRWRQYPK